MLYELVALLSKRRHCPRSSTANASSLLTPGDEAREQGIRTHESMHCNDECTPEYTPKNSPPIACIAMEKHRALHTPEFAPKCMHYYNEETPRVTHPEFAPDCMHYYNEETSCVTHPEFAPDCITTMKKHHTFTPKIRPRMHALQQRNRPEYTPKNPPRALHTPIHRVIHPNPRRIKLSSISKCLP